MTEAAFLSALHEAPNDEVTWLALADWLEEDGQSERAELVRLVRQLRTVPVMKRTKPRPALEGRVMALLNAGVKPVVPEVVNSVGIRLALIPPGRFRMGSPGNEKGRFADETAREVEITRPFYLGVFAVTQAQYEAVMGSNPSYFSVTGEGKEKVAGLDTRAFPVEGVSWDDAGEFCRRLNEKERKGRGKLVYRLPSEAEWEYSCRGGASSTPFHVGVSLTSSQANFNGEHPYGSADKGPYLGRPSAGGSYAPNVFGLYDMHGNVYEWCADWYGEYPEGPGTDPPGSPDGSARVFRGGSWYDYGRYCRAANRSRFDPEYRYYDLGFRLAAVPHE